MDLIYLQTFREVALRQSFTRAAEELGYAQSSVTTQVQKLEKAYGVELFERFGRGLRLTAAGEELLRLTIKMLDLFQESKERMAKQGGGTLSIGTIDSIASYYLPPHIQRLRREYPELAIRLRPDSEIAIAHRVREGELDLGLILGSGQLDPSLEWRAIREESLVLVANPRHPLTRLNTVQLAHLSGMEWYMSEDSCNYRIMLEKVLRANSIAFRIGLELGNPEAIKRCVMVGEGIALLPRMAVEEQIQRGELAALPFTHPDIRLDLQLVTHPKKWFSHAQREFISQLSIGRAV
ncbi:LysR family transcriptional regulator [Paenibacillus sacheonensis]|uniref:LysR family transcriptional regulator n=1 Tax=Paenibacillus sacheonensis TaxID=742054 RepID=A0A7X4YRN1_9BACL|nr:LysR family transcriptional regulator [Paenibacillus sacheonensis]MBM7567591.1 DNA-binding transcriptional LysR family regulator [Paenibacillus sacheonensis]NBC71306.1 LysR family transcriptional regulator [Paenibacillus sacheonensis]